MAIFEDLYDTAKVAFDKASKKTNDVMDKSKLKIKCYRLEDELRRAYERLGVISYEQAKTDVDKTDVINSCAKEIDLIKASIDSVKKEIARIDKYIKCTACGTYNDKDGMYCKKCGVRL